MMSERKTLFLAALAATLVGCGGGGGSGGDSGGGSGGSGVAPPPPANTAPTADAGADRIANEKATVALTGTGADTDGTIASYRWEQVSGPNVTLADAAAAATEFTAPDWASDSATLVFRLTVTDDDGATGSDEVTVTVNALPQAQAGADRTVDEKTAVELAGAGTDRDGTIESWRWEKVSGPDVALTDADTATAGFTAPDYASDNAVLLFRLTVTDDRGATHSDEVTLTVKPPPDTVTPPTGTGTPPTNPGTPPTDGDDPFAERWKDLEPKPWWRMSAPYSCTPKVNSASPWIPAGLDDLGGADSLSLIRWFGNGSYLYYGFMGFGGCTPLDKYDDSFYLDPPADPTYYSTGDLEIHVDIARVPANAEGWSADDGRRVEFSMDRAVSLLNTHVAAYFRRVSQDKLRITFRAGHEFDVGGNGSPDAMNNQFHRLAGACIEECEHGAPGGLNRLLLDDVAANTGGNAWNGSAHFGLASFEMESMETIVHEIGHGWMFWPHSYAEVPWRGEAGEEPGPPNPYSNFYDVMSQLDLVSNLGWDAGKPSTLAINRYAAGWIDRDDVALHLTDSATYTLGRPFGDGHQFLVIHSGRRYAFTTLEVLEERTDRYKVSRADVYDPSSPGGRRARRYDGVLVSRYDQTAGTGLNVRFGPALYDSSNPEFLIDVHWGRDDYSLIPDGSSRDIGGGVSVSVAKNDDGSYEVTVSGGRIAGFERWCEKIWFTENEYDTGCFLDTAEWE